MKRYHLLTTILFCLFIGSMGLISSLTPDRGFSEMENRNLQPLPELTYNRFSSGRFMTEAEKYTSDQIAFRDGWVGLKALGEVISGKKENNGIYFAEGNILIRCIPEPEVDRTEENIQYLHGFASQSDVPVYFGLIPAAASVWRDRLPAGAPSADEEVWTESLYSKSGAINIDLASSLKAHSQEYIYYRTDHHWTSLGAFYGANDILNAMGLEELQLSDYSPREVSSVFLGTNYSSSGAWWTDPDTITAYIPEDGKDVISNFTGREEPGRLYAPEQLEVKNKYAYFLGGNQPLCVIRSQSDGPKLLLIRDSYSDCLAPFLTEHFREVHLFDLRYNRLSPLAYIWDNDIDVVLVLYSFETYITDENQFLLTR